MLQYFGYTMRERFVGEDGERMLCSALRQQPTLQCDVDAIAALAKVAVVREYAAEDMLIIQNTDDNSIAFILSGKVDVLVNDRCVASRQAGQHVGEMSVIDPSARRSATIAAAEDTCVAWVKEADFTTIALRHPTLWRALAVDIANRLRQRAAFVRPPNSILQLFIGSSREGLAVAEGLRERLVGDAIQVNLWSDGVFGASNVTIESLETCALITDFAILVCTADDKTVKRDELSETPRDNIIFELGLFMGAIGRLRTFIVLEKDKRVRIPTDLEGVTYLSFSRSNETVLSQNLDEAVKIIKKRVRESGAR